MVSHFSNSFKNPKRRRPKIETLISQSISTEDRDNLERLFTEEEVLNAITSLGQDRAPGPDSFPMKFFSLCWQTIKVDLMRIFHSFFLENKLESCLKHNFIALVPKKKEAEEIRDYRPISLVGSVYKIISKVLAERLKTTLPRLISPNQSSFVEGRQILDGILIANECVDSRAKSGIPGLVCKLDFEKAFDNVSWEFINEVLFHMGFGGTWRAWIRNCLSFAKFSVLINGSSFGFFESEKGLCQGDPLSPFLFVLVSQVLSNMFSKAQEAGWITRFSVTVGGTVVNHLQFADDTIVFLEAKREQVNYLRYILLCFELMSGLKINFSKSSLFGIALVEDIDRFASMLGCKKAF